MEMEVTSAPSPKSCECDNCMKLKCLFENLTDLKCLIQQFKLAFSDDLPSTIEGEIIGFLNSDWKWQEIKTDTNCKGTTSKVLVKEESGVRNEDSGCFADEKSDEETKDENDTTPQIAIKSAASLFEPEEEEEEEDFKEEESTPIITAVTSVPNPSMGQGLLNSPKLLNKNDTTSTSSKNKKWIQCAVCDLSFNSIDQLNDHMLTHEITHQCSECELGFYSAEEAMQHICPLVAGSQMDSKEDDPGPSSADFSFEKGDSDEIVIISDDEDEDDLLEQSSSEMKVDVEGVEGEDLMKCRYCDTYFLTKDELDEHEVKAHELGAVKDRYSGIVYKMSNQSGYCCGLCGKTCNSIFNFNTHLRSRHKANPLKPPDNICQQCGKAYDTLTRLKRHITYQHGGQNSIPKAEKPGHECNVCGKSFPSSYRLLHHYRTHTGEKPEECEFCGKRFRNTSHLNDHRRIHTGERPYKCLHCGSAYIQGSQLKAHLRSRHGMPV